MIDSFSENNREFWGFSLKHNGIMGKPLQKFSGTTVAKSVAAAFSENWELHYIPTAQCIFIKTSKEIWHFLFSEQEAIDFKKNLVFSRHYPCCEIY